MKKRVWLVDGSGREESMVLLLDGNGMTFLSGDGQGVFKYFPYEEIMKWLPSHRRTRNPGAEECLDVQFRTAGGPQILRLRAEDMAAAEDVRKALKERVKGLTGDTVSRGGSGALDLNDTLALGSQMSLVSQQSNHWFLGPDGHQHSHGSTERRSTARRSSMLSARISGVQPKGQNARQVSERSASRDDEDVSRTSRPTVKEGRRESSLGDTPASTGCEDTRRIMKSAASIIHSLPAVSGDSEEENPGTQLEGPAQSSNSEYKQNKEASIESGSAPANRGDGAMHERRSSTPEQPSSIQEHKQSKEAVNGSGTALTSYGAVPIQQHKQSAEECQQMPLERMRSDANVNRQPEDTATSCEAGWDPRLLSVTPELQSIVLESKGGGQGTGTAGGAARFYGPGTVQGAPPSQPWAGVVDDAGQQARHADTGQQLGVGVSGRQTGDNNEGLQTAAQLEVAGPAGSNDNDRVRFLEGVISHLSAALFQSESANASTPGAMEEGALHKMASSDILGRDPVGSVPPWMSDIRYVSPLVMAYDVQMNQLNKGMEQITELVETTKQQLGEVIQENEDLRDQVTQHMHVIKRMEMQSGNAEGAFEKEASDLIKRMDLLTQENDLLVAQQQQTEEEVIKLNQQLQLQTADYLKLGQENMSLAAQLRTQEVEAGERQKEFEQSEEALQQTAALCRALEQDVSQLTTQLEEAKGQLEQLRGALGRCENEKGAAVQDAQALALQVEEFKGRSLAAEDTLDRVDREASCLNDTLNFKTQEVLRLQEALRSADCRVHEYQQKDVDAVSRIKAAVEASEAAKLARDASLRREMELSKELECLNNRLADLRQEVTQQLDNEHKGQMAQLRQHWEGERSTNLQLRQELACLRSTSDGLAHEKQVLEQQLERLRVEFVSGQLTCATTGITVGSLEELDRVSRLEQDRQEAAHKLDSSERAMERKTKEWEFQKRQYEVTIGDLRQQASDLQASSSTLKGEAASCRHKLEVAERQLAALRESKSSTEGKLHNEMEGLRSEHEKELAALVGRMEKKVKSYEQTIKDAEGMIENKDKLLARWKEEAMVIASRLDRAVSQHARDQEEQDTTLAALQQQVAEGRQEREHLTLELQALQRTESDLKSAYEYAEDRAAAAEARLAEVEWSEEQLLQEKNELMAQLDRAALSIARAERERDSFGLKCETLRRQGVDTMPRSSGKRPSAVDVDFLSRHDEEDLKPMH